jgi:hypothetical protein
VRHAISIGCSAISRSTRCTVPLPTPTIAATLSMPCPAFRCSRMAASIFGDSLWAAELLPLLAHAIETGKYPAGNDLPFLLAEYRRHLDHRAAHWGCAVDGLLVGIEADAGSIEFGQGICHMKDAPPKSVDGPHHQDIEPSPHRVFEHRVECWALISTLGPPDALVFVCLDNHPSTMLGRLRQHEPLVIGGTVVTAHAKVDRCANPIGAHPQPSHRYETTAQ